MFLEQQSDAQCYFYDWKNKQKGQFSFEDVSNALKQEYDNDFRLETQFVKRKQQNDEPVIQFFCSFANLCSRIGITSEITFRTEFIDRLLPDIKHFVKSNFPKSLSQALALAQEKELELWMNLPTILFERRLKKYFYIFTPLTEAMLIIRRFRKQNPRFLNRFSLMDHLKKLDASRTIKTNSTCFETAEIKEDSFTIETNSINFETIAQHECPNTIEKKSNCF